MVGTAGGGVAGVCGAGTMEAEEATLPSGALAMDVLQASRIDRKIARIKNLWT